MNLNSFFEDARERGFYTWDREIVDFLVVNGYCKDKDNAQKVVRKMSEGIQVNRHALYWHQANMKKEKTK